MLEALASGCETVDQIVDRIYSGLHPSVVRAAADSVLAHLIKLRDEGESSKRMGGGASSEYWLRGFRLQPEGCVRCSTR